MAHRNSNLPKWGEHLADLLRASGLTLPELSEASGTRLDLLRRLRDRNDGSVVDLDDLSSLASVLAPRIGRTSKETLNYLISRRWDGVAA